MCFGDAGTRTKPLEGPGSDGWDGDALKIMAKRSVTLAFAASVSSYADVFPQRAWRRRRDAAQTSRGPGSDGCDREALKIMAKKRLVTLAFAVLVSSCADLFPQRASETVQRGVESARNPTEVSAGSSGHLTLSPDRDADQPLPSSGQ